MQSSFKSCGLTVNIDVSDVLTQMHCFGENGQLKAHTETYMRAVRRESDSDGEDDDDSLFVDKE